MPSAPPDTPQPTSTGSCRTRPIGGFSKALWVACVILVPFLGTLIYLIARPAGATREERQMMDEANRELVTRYSPDNGVSELTALADLHDRGKLEQPGQQLGA